MLYRSLVAACLVSTVLGLPQNVQEPSSTASSDAAVSTGSEEPTVSDLTNTSKCTITSRVHKLTGLATLVANDTENEAEEDSDNVEESGEAEVENGQVKIGGKGDTCTTKGIPFETTVEIETVPDRMKGVEGTWALVEDTDGWWSYPKDTTSDWTFSTEEKGIVFGKPGFLQQSRPGEGYASAEAPTPERTANNMTVTMSIDTGHKLLGWLVYKVDGEPEDKYWEYLADDDKAPKATNDKHKFDLTIKGYYPCENPVSANSSCKENTIERTPEQWEAYGVAKWLDGWLYKQKEAGNTNLMEQFRKNYVSSIQHTCNIRGECDSIGSCTNLPNKGVNKDSAQAYLAWTAMENLSDTFYKMYDSVFEAQSDVLTQIASLALKFNKPPPEHKKQEINTSAWNIASGVLGIFSGVMGFIPGAMPAGSVARIVGSVAAGSIVKSGTIPSATGVISAILGLVKPTPKDPPAFDAAKHYAFNQANITAFLGQYTIGLRNSLESSYNNIFDEPYSLNRAIKDGSYVNRTVLNLNCNECDTQRRNWLKQYMTLRMINQMWLENNVFVTYIPYGEVTQVGSNSKTEFTGKECYDHFRKGGKDDEDKLTVCMEDGMARLAWFDPFSEKNPIVETTKQGQGKIYFGEPPPGWDTDPEELTVFGKEGEVKWRAEDATSSSMETYLKYGFTTDGIEQIGNSNDDATEQLTGIFDMKPNSPGVFSLPVCELDNLNMWPTLWSSSDNVQGRASLCHCAESKDKNGKRFADAVNENLKFVAEHRLGKGYLHDCITQEVPVEEYPWDKKS